MLVMVLFHHHSSIYNKDWSKAGFGQLCSNPCYIYYLVQILEPLKLFLRDNDGSLRLSDGNALGYNFYKFDQYYLSSNAIKASHRTELRKKLNERWIFGHTELHSVAFILH